VASKVFPCFSDFFAALAPVFPCLQASASFTVAYACLCPFLNECQLPQPLGERNGMTHALLFLLSTHTNYTSRLFPSEYPATETAVSPTVLPQFRTLAFSSLTLNPPLPTVSEGITPLAPGFRKCGHIFRLPQSVPFSLVLGTSAYRRTSQSLPFVFFFYVSYSAAKSRFCSPLVPCCTCAQDVPPARHVRRRLLLPFFPSRVDI